ncbi:hypothetical protein G4228_009233 [Cervus hanglu yarkandensis]|nr:hypothetical protein G4228_009233 [Cervus hanglu yarkandensis]
MPTMRLFTCFLQLLTGLALPAVPPQQWALSSGNISSEVEVVPFQRVWERSYCQPVERLVDIVSEYPSEMEHLFSPSCVSLLRCTGCCSDEKMHCMPLETANITLQLLKYRALDLPFFVEMSFSQHISCECSHGPGRQSQDKSGDCGAFDHLPSSCSLTLIPEIAATSHVPRVGWWPLCLDRWPCPSLTASEDIPRGHSGRKGHPGRCKGRT